MPNFTFYAQAHNGEIFLILIPFGDSLLLLSEVEKDGTIEQLNSTLNKFERKRQGKNETPSLLCINSQSVKVAAFISKDKGIDGHKLVNGLGVPDVKDTLLLIRLD